MTASTQTLLLPDGAPETLEMRELPVRLEVPGGEATTFMLGLSSCVVGSGADADLAAADPGVSRRHCELSRSPQGLRVRDLGSKNGTFVQGVRVLDALVPIGGVITLAGSRLVVMEPRAPRSVPLSPEPRFGQALGASVPMRALFALLKEAATSDVPVLLLGETGTGKDLLARAIHQHSPRRDGPFVVFDCSSVAPSLIEAELFGHTRGAFTGAASARIGMLEQAHGGTVLLDELGELPLELQARLLRALESRTVRPLGANAYRPADARIIAATHRDLRAKVREGTFREDLYFRLAVVIAQVPPLRERREDLPLLVSAFLSRQTPPRQMDALPANLLPLLEAHDWPGNVRELWNTVQRLVLFPLLGARAIDAVAPPSPEAPTPEADAELPWREAREAALAAFELAYLKAGLEREGGNLSALARHMGISRQFLYRLLETHGLRSTGAGGHTPLPSGRLRS